MSMPVMFATMGSVFVGFLFFGSAFASFMYNKSKKQIWTLFSIAIVLITIVPLLIGIYVANNPS
ncbi:hypothetical protein PAB09_12560 [Corynebacterium sp. SCR221107]|uniref:hypothetical protein n=1 Tax=Corynebacterium sp. SCR221107 TaxID=3017361 RepID=UPI0022EC587E|nr:hypothetical protein [Corynebacterium sp. SCR221107]WBT08670.1 hypothetical protein PAB09_12560 [Corynebacterium sp. SCR221107]